MGARYVQHRASGNGRILWIEVCLIATPANVSRIPSLGSAEKPLLDKNNGEIPHFLNAITFANPSQTPSIDTYTLT